MPSHSNSSMDHASQPPKCASCSCRVWIASKPRRGGPGRHPQDGRGWFDRAAGAFLIGMLFCAVLTLLVVIGYPLLPAWALWCLCAAAISCMFAAVIVADGIAVESKSCQIVCGQCGEQFTASWRPKI